MKIVHCIYSFNTGGTETMLVDILNQQVKTEEVTVIVVNDSFQTYLIGQIDKRVRIVFLHRKPSSRSLRPVLKLNYLLFRLRPDVIHIHSYSMPAIIFPFMGRRLFYTVHALHVPMKYAGRLNCLFAISDAVKQDILSRGSYPVITIPNGIFLQKIVPRERKDIPAGGEMRVVQVARLDVDTKGQDILIRALSLLKKKGLTTIRVDFIGEGDSENALKRLVKKLDVENQVRFLGFCDRNYIYQHLQEYDLMCHPARSEGFGLTVAEAMAAELPVLVATGGGPYEITACGKFGYVFENGCVQDCADKIEGIYRNYCSALKCVKEARLHVAENYSLERMVGEYLRAYRFYK